MKNKSYIVLLLLWSSLIFISYYLNYNSARDSVFDNVLGSSRSFFKEIVTTRQWNAMHGGVYVPITDITRPNPYLDIPDRDIETTDGKKLTKINPAFMTRQISELALQQNDVLYHITSLKPIRPANNADNWEVDALEKFSKSTDEIFELTKYGNQDYFRYMAPLYVGSSCMKCHEKQGYKVGDIRGGISVNIPASNHLKSLNSHIFQVSAIHIFLFLVGFVAILWFKKVNERHIVMLNKTNFELRKEIKYRQHAENEMKCYLDELNYNRDLLEKRAGELNLINLELSEKSHELRELNATKDIFFSIIAHDMRNPIGAFKGLASLLHEDYQNLSEEEKREYIELIFRSADNIYSLIENLLTWSRAQSGKITFAPDFILLDSIAQQNINVLEQHAIKKDIELNMNIQQGTLAWGDPNMISTVIRNLMSNAIKFTPIGGAVEIGAIQEGEEQIIFVKDNGLGISQDMQKNLFRIDVSTSTEGTSKEQGTGLGLILCHDFVKKNNGRIWVKSCEGKGTTFFFSLAAGKGG